MLVNTLTVSHTLKNQNKALKWSLGSDFFFLKTSKHRRIISICHSYFSETFYKQNTLTFKNYYNLKTIKD